MADGVALTPGTGVTVATDDTGATGHIQLVKLAYSADGVATLVQVDADGQLVNLGANNDVTVTSGTITANHATTGLGSGRKVVTTAGTRVALASSTAAKWVIITAELDNTDVVVVGSAAGVIAALTTREGTPLAPGDTAIIACDNLADIGLDSVVSGEGVTYSYGTGS